MRRSARTPVALPVRVASSLTLACATRRASAYRVRNQPGNASASLGWSLSWVFDWSDMGRSGWQRARATLSLRPVRMAPATLTAHRIYMFATVFAFATPVALLLLTTLLSSNSRPEDRQGVVS